MRALKFGGSPGRPSPPLEASEIWGYFGNRPVSSGGNGAPGRPGRPPGLRGDDNEEFSVLLFSDSDLESFESFSSEVLLVFGLLLLAWFC